MKEAIVHLGPKVEIRDVEVPKPGPKQVLIKVEYSGCNPKDWKVPEFFPDAPPCNQGDDIAGIVEEVGSEVYEFKKGDRVAAFHEMREPGGSYGEYAIAYDHTTFFLPKHTSFQEGAAIPLAAMTAAIGLFADDRLAIPYSPIFPATEPLPLLIYGASSAVGIYAIQLARKANIHPIIAVSGRAQAHVEQFLDRSKGDTIVDYRTDNDTIVKAIRAAVPAGQKLHHGFDCVAEAAKHSFQNISKALDGGRITMVLPVEDLSAIPKTVQHSMTTVGDAHGSQKDLAFVYFRLITRGLENGWFKAQKQEEVPGGLTGIQSALDRLKSGEASAVKYIFKIADTPK